MKNKIIFGLIIISLVLLPFVVSDYNPGHLCSEVNTGIIGIGSCGKIYSQIDQNAGTIEGYNPNTGSLSRAIEGHSSETGVFGEGVTGVWGEGSSKGVFGGSTNGYGVYGKSTNGYGVYADCVTYGCYGFYG